MLPKINKTMAVPLIVGLGTTYGAWKTLNWLRTADDTPLFETFCKEKDVLATLLILRSTKEFYSDHFKPLQQQMCLVEKLYKELCTMVLWRTHPYKVFRYYIYTGEKEKTRHFIQEWTILCYRIQLQEQVRMGVANWMDVWRVMQHQNEHGITGKRKKG